MDFHGSMELTVFEKQLESLSKMDLENPLCFKVEVTNDGQKTALAKGQYENALHILRPKSKRWTVPVHTVSALNNQGISAVWEMLLLFKETMTQSGEFDENRKRQSVDWMWALVMDDLKSLFMHHGQVQRIFQQVIEGVAEGTITPSAASRRLLEVFRKL
jgi:LAO/AO transport system kinase